MLVTVILCVVVSMCDYDDHHVLLDQHFLNPGLFIESRQDLDVKFKEVTSCTNWSQLFL